MPRTALFALVWLASAPLTVLAAGVPTVPPHTATARDDHPGRYQHIVLFKYRAEVSPAQKQEVIRLFLALERLCLRNGRPYISSIVTGAQNSTEGAARGLEQGFIVTFRSEGDRNYYVGAPGEQDSRFADPAHAAFKRFVAPLLAPGDGVLVFDFREQD